VANWVWLGLLSAVFAGLVGVVGKRGLDAVDPTLGTAVRAVIMALFLVFAALALGKMKGLAAIPRGALLWIAASGLCGAASWLCYFWALRFGPAGAVAAVDRLSVVFALLFAALFLRERLTPLTLLGGALMVLGALLVLRGR
jgi:transporter family protein